MSEWTKIKRGLKRYCDVCAKPAIWQHGATEPDEHRCKKHGPVEPDPSLTAALQTLRSLKT